VVADTAGEMIASMPSININIPIIKADYQTWEAWTESLPLWARVGLMILAVAIALYFFSKYL